MMFNDIISHNVNQNVSAPLLDTFTKRKLISRRGVEQSGSSSGS